MIDRSRFSTTTVIMSMDAYIETFVPVRIENTTLFMALVLSGMAIAAISGSVCNGWNFFGVVYDDLVGLDEIESMILRRKDELEKENSGN